MNLHQKLLEIRKSCEYLKKDNSGFQFKYVSSSQTLGTLRGKMDEVGVLLLPSVTSFEIRDHTTSKGGHEYFTILAMTFTWIDADNPEDKITCSWTGQGLDSGEKGVGKALTYAEKYFMLKFFNIATDSDDPDRFQKKHEPGKKKPETPGEKPNPVGARPPAIMSDPQRKKLFAMAKGAEFSDTEVSEFSEFLKKLDAVGTMQVGDNTKITVSGASYIFDNFDKLKGDFIELKMTA